MADSLSLALVNLEDVSFADLTYPVAQDVAEAIKAIGTTPAVIRATLRALTVDRLDTLMRVLYCCLASDPTESNVYLQWHSEVYTIAGIGSVMRVLTSR